MAIPPQLLLAAARMLKNRKSPTAQIKEALAPATDALKNDIAPLVGMGADAGMMYNLRAEDPSMRTGIATGAIGSAARGFQANGIKGLITGGIMGGLTGAIATGNAKEQKAEQDKYTYLNQMYSSVVGVDTDLQSALMYAEDGGEIVSAEGETFVPIQTEAKKIGKKLVKEKFIFSDGKIADVNATKPHSEQKKDAVTDITVEGTYVMPVSTKLSKKDLDSLISYSTSNYSENGKNFAVKEVTVRDILGEKFEGSFAEATDIVVKKYPVMDTDDDLDPIARITNNENIANRSKIIAHLIRLNESKINKEPIEEVKLTPSMKAKKGSFISKYVLNPKMSLKKGGYIRKMAVGGGVGDPPGKKYKSANGTMIVGEDGKYYFGKQDGSYIEANPQTVDIFTKQLAASKNPSGGDNPWLLVEDTKGKSILGANPAIQQPRHEIIVANDLDPSLRDVNPIYSQDPIDILGNAVNSSGSLIPRKKINIPVLPQRTNPILKSINTPDVSSLMTTDLNSITDQMTTPSDIQPIDGFMDMITERKGDAVRDAEEAKTGYKALSKRVGMRDLMQLGTGLLGIKLQDRTEKRAFKIPLYIDQKYRGLSPQQINQQAEAGTGAGVEAIKQMMNGGGDRVTARLAPILIDRLIQQQGQTRKAYVDQNTQFERAKYAERGAIQQANLDEEARAKNVERDFNNKAIAGTSSLINKYISSKSAGDINDFATARGIEQDLTNKLYALDNQEMQVDMIGKNYDMEMSEVNQKIADIEAELSNPNTNLDETAKASLKSYQESYKQIAKELDKKKIRSNINGQ